MKPIKVTARQFASAVVQYLACQGRFEILANAPSCGEALTRAGIERPDLMLVDLSMPGMNGLAMVAHLKALEAPPEFVMMTLEDSESHQRCDCGGR